MSWLWDPVFAIREAAVENLKNLTVIFGSQWATEEILSRLLNKRNSKMDEDGSGVGNGNNTGDENDDDDDDDNKIDYSNFIIRITCLFAITSLIPVINYSVLVDKVLPFINGLITDSVPNIRFNVAKSYLTLVQSLIQQRNQAPNEDELKKLINLQVLSNLEKLESDEDVDVRFYSTQSIKGINEILAQ